MAVLPGMRYIAASKSQNIPTLLCSWVLTPVLRHGGGSGGQGQGNPEADNDHRQLILISLLVVNREWPSPILQATTRVETSCTNWTSCGGRRLWWTWCWSVRRPSLRSPLTSCYLLPAHLTSTLGWWEGNVCLFSSLQFQYCWYLNLRFSSAWEGTGDCRDNEGRQRVQVTSWL